MQMSQGRINEVESKALRYIRNSIIHEGRSPSVRDLASFLEYKSPRSAHLIIESLIDLGLLRRSENGKLQVGRDMPIEENARTVDIPLVGNVACGTPLLAEENIEAYIPISTGLAKSGGKYFLLRAVGDSMNEAGIGDGDFVLVRQQQTAENGDRVVALIDDEATVKELRRETEVMLLKPRSSNKKHRPIVVTENFIIQGVVTSVLPSNFNQ